MITLEQKGNRNILLFDRDINNERIVTEIRDFKPYFYTEDFLEGAHTTIYNERCKKIFTESSRDVSFERLKYSKVYEADIHYTDRYLIDRIKTPIPKRNLRKCYIDIENDDSLDTFNVPKPITMICCFDNYLNKIVQFIYREDIKDYNEKSSDVSYYYFGKENNMLNYFIRFVRETDPDLLIAFNIDFDLSYIINRCKKLQVFSNSMSPMNYVKIDRYGIRVYGRVVIDIKKLVKKNFIRKELFSYTLDNVSKHLLGKGKIGVESSKGKLWKENLGLLIKYNQEDVLLIKEIDEKFSVIDFYDTLRRRVGCGWDRVTSFSYLHDIETYRKGKEFNLVIPKTDLKEKKQAEGAFVQEPKKGLYTNIINLDVKCIAEGTVVITEKGNKAIENINEGDYIFGINGFDKVIKIKKEKYDGYLYEVCIDNNKLLVTPTHFFPYLRACYSKSLNYLVNKKIENIYKKINIYNSSLFVSTNIERIGCDDFSLFMGVIEAEGYCCCCDTKYFCKERKKYRISHRNQIVITINKNENDFMNEISRLVYKFHGNHKWKEKKGSNGIALCINNKKLFNKILEWKAKNSYTKEEMASFLRSFFEGDGSFHIKRKNITLSQGGKNYKKMNLVKKFLDAFEIKYVFLERTVKRKNTETGLYDRLDLIISEKSNIIKFSGYIGFISKEKQKKLNYVSSKKKFDMSVTKFYKLTKPIIKKVYYCGNVYDISLLDSNNPYFFANNILTHNSMYPYAILSANISPETLSDDGDIIIEKNLRFNSKPLGIIPSIIKDEMNHRDETKKAMYKELKKNGKSTLYDSLYLMQYANKVLMNSIYGLFNTEFYVLKERKITEAITSLSRQAIQWSIEVVNKAGYEVIYCDTDGIYIDSKTLDKQEVVKIGKSLQKQINESYKDFLLTLGIKNGNLEIKFENIYDSFFIGSKKHYFGHLCWNENNEVDEMVIKGYEVIRVDSAKVCKEMMDTVFKMILGKKGRENIDMYIKNLRNSLKGLPIQEIGIPKPYRKENKVRTAWFKAVQFSNKYLNTGIKEGERILYVYGSVYGLPKTEAFAFRLDNLDVLKDKKIIIDWERMNEVLINNKIVRLYEALGYESNKIESLTNYF